MPLAGKRIVTTQSLSSQSMVTTWGVLLWKCIDHNDDADAAAAAAVAAAAADDDGGGGGKIAKNKKTINDKNISNNN